MPVFSKADTDEKIIAVTVDDCFQADNLKQIVDAAIAVNGKLTIFPIGYNAIKKEQAEVLRYAWENGFELENHTYTHNGLFACSAEEAIEEIYKQQVTDINRTKAFYIDLLGFKLEYERPENKFMFLSFEGSQFMFEEIHTNGWNTADLEYPLGRGINF